MLVGTGVRVVVVNLALLACILRSTNKKGHQLFGEKVHPRENPCYAYALRGELICVFVALSQTLMRQSTRAVPGLFTVELLLVLILPEAMARLS